MSRALSRAKATARVAALPRIVIYVVGTGLWLTGALWLLFHYLLKRQGWLGGVQPLESWWLRLHGAFAFVAIWTFGLLWGTHVVPGWWTRRRARSGIVLVAFVAWLMVSAYLLYYLGNEEQRFIVSVLHWSVGLSCPVLFTAHRWRDRASVLQRGRVLNL
jgi:hypothetical protein